MNMEALRMRLVEMRGALDLVFASDTAANGTAWKTGSAGHCAVVAILVRDVFGGSLVSANVRGVSHWFNRLSDHLGSVDVDLTGDQFDRDPVQAVEGRQLWVESRLRSPDELTLETWQRYALLRYRLARIGRGSWSVWDVWRLP